mmetsp:Transcript_16410/g.24726  ORF Transcript_16410/g.24726 Transcript_16410/m.24726 type:complete len:217 (-) Transcript_16410:146-796(-)
MQFFSKTPQDKSSKRKEEIKRTSRSCTKQIARGERDINREIRDIERNENELIGKIKTAHKKGQQNDLKVYSKQLVQVRQVKQRLQSSARQMGAAKVQNTMIAHSAIAAESMGSVAAAVSSVNKIVNPDGIQHTMTDFCREMEKTSIQDEAWDDMIDMFDGDSVDDEADSVLNQVMDEIGLATDQSIQSAPIGGVMTSRRELGDNERERKLEGVSGL